MKSLRVSSVLFAALLALTIGGKLLAMRSEPTLDAPLFARSAARLLADAGFQAGISVRPLIIVVQARRGECRMELREYDPHGTYLSAFQARARPVGRLSFVYRGHVSRDPPKVLSLMEYYFWREAVRVGLSPSRAPVIAVAASPGCDLHGIAWDRIATLPR